MGLAGPKQRQKIGNDPRNKAWKQDTTAIGFQLLEKMGWQQGKGLGATENGMVQNIKVTQKDNHFGVGADVRTKDNWLDNAFAFDSLLQGLNNDTVVPTITPITSTCLRNPHRAKFVRNKQVSNYDSAQIHNILGKTRTGEIQHPTREEVKKNQESLILDGVQTITKTVGIQDYFAQKMAQRGLVLGAKQSITTAGPLSTIIAPVELSITSVESSSIALVQSVRVKKAKKEKKKAKGVSKKKKK